MTVICNCGGHSGVDHPLGSKKCFRELVPIKDEPKYAGSTRGTGMWHYLGTIITEYALRNQCLVIMDPKTGRWTRPKDQSSMNSIE